MSSKKTASHKPPAAAPDKPSPQTDTSIDVTALDGVRKEAYSLKRRYFHISVLPQHIGRVLENAECCGVSLVNFTSQPGSAKFLFIFQRTQDTSGSDQQIEA